MTSGATEQQLLLADSGCLAACLAAWAMQPVARNPQPVQSVWPGADANGPSVYITPKTQAPLRLATTSPNTYNQSIMPASECACLLSEQCSSSPVLTLLSLLGHS